MEDTEAKFIPYSYFAGINQTRTSTFQDNQHHRKKEANYMSIVKGQTQIQHTHTRNNLERTALLWQDQQLCTRKEVLIKKTRRQN